MKKVNKNLLVAVALMLGTLINYANVESISKNTSTSTKVIFENVEKGHALVIKDHSGTVIYNENISKNGKLIKFYDFSHLDNGDYSIEVEKEYELLIKEFNVKNGVTTLKSEEVIFRPVILTKKDRVFISRINFDKSPLNVTVYYKGYVILEETISSEDKVLEKTYHLDQALKGDYTVTVSSKNSSSRKEFNY